MGGLSIFVYDIVDKQCVSVWVQGYNIDSSDCLDERKLIFLQELFMQGYVLNEVSSWCL